MVFFKKVQTLAAIALFGILSAPSRANSQISPIGNAASAQKRVITNKNEVTLQKAKERVLFILREENGCSAWFREADPDAAGVFESLQIQIAKRNREYVLRTSDAAGANSYKHPWGARSTQLAGRNSRVEINPEGPFFAVSLPVIQMGPGGVFLHYEGYRTLTVGGFRGDSTEAQTTLLLHELAHVIGRVPEDDDSWDGRSVRNTEEVLRNCKSEVQGSTQRTLRASR